MVKLERFDIEFNNPEHAYFAGQEVSGKIIIETREDKRINEILLEIKGRAKTYWTKHTGKSRRHCSCSEPYFCEQFNTHYTHRFTTSNADPGSSSPDPDNDRAKPAKGRILPAGVHEIPFSYTLPKTLPSSFEGEFGFVRYTCRAICERPWDFDIVSRRAFTVIGIEDINEDPQALEPSSASNSMQHHQLCCIRQGEVSVEIKLERAGYTPGEQILLSGKIANCSRRLIKSACLRLRQHVTYRAKTFSGVDHTKQISREVAKLEKREIQPGTEQYWTQEKIVIPSVTPRLSKCKIIEASSSAKASLPIVVGTIPLLSDILTKVKPVEDPGRNGSTQNNGPVVGDNPPQDANDTVVQVIITDESGRIRATNAEELGEGEQLLDAETEALNSAKKRVRMPSSILSELYPSLPSPYYRESSFGRTNISDEKERNQFGDNNFAPKYPFYTD
ncbi:arrestin domain-containing protein 17 [Ditylenchus destructor]|uniref:Arrestin domain-containing protein 17 n=1 Tax=Ditylenchus destructor TaxID=166010 RepID=A0AAD4RDF4_9BILA|nr:arrestin domain-containing protein 17 [Ditylenchus destructor]